MQGWTLFQCTLDDGPAAYAPIGLYANRIPMPKTVTVDTLQQMGDSISEVAAGLVLDVHLDAIIYGCTSGSMTIGPEQIAAKVRNVRPNVAVTDSITTELKGLRRLGCQRIALLTPYVAEVNHVVERYIHGQGFELAAMGSFNQAGDPEIIIEDFLCND